MARKEDENVLKKYSMRKEEKTPKPLYVDFFNSQVILDKVLNLQSTQGYYHFDCFFSIIVHPEEKGNIVNQNHTYMSTYVGVYSMNYNACTFWFINERASLIDRSFKFENMWFTGKDDFMLNRLKNLLHIWIFCSCYFQYVAFTDVQHH